MTKWRNHQHSMLANVQPIDNNIQIAHFSVESFTNPLSLDEQQVLTGMLFVLCCFHYVYVYLDSDMGNTVKTDNSAT